MKMVKLIILSDSRIIPAHFSFSGVDNSFSFEDISPVIFAFARG